MRCDWRMRSENRNDGGLWAYPSSIAVIRLGVILLFWSVEVVLQYSELLYEAGATDQIDASRLGPLPKLRLYPTNWVF